MAGKKPTIRPQTTPAIFRSTAPSATAAEPGKPVRIKRTFYLTLDDIRALEEMQRDAWVPGEGKPELSQLVSQAIQTLRQRKHSEGGDS